MPKKKPAPETTEPPFFWAVMKAYSWGSLSVGGLSIGSPPKGPQRFMPLFETREQAVAWDNGCEDNIGMMRGGEMTLEKRVE